MRTFEYLMRAKYHLEVCERLLKGYEEEGSKRYLAGFIRELKHATTGIIAATTIHEGIREPSEAKRLERFMKDNGTKHFTKQECLLLYKTIELAHAQKNSPIQFSKQDTIILLIHKEYRFVTVKRLKEFYHNTKKCSHKLTSTFRQV